MNKVLDELKALVEESERLFKLLEDRSYRKVNSKLKVIKSLDLPNFEEREITNCRSEE